MLRLLRARRAVAGLEFAIVVPALFTLLAGAVDLSLATLTARRLTQAAEEVGLVASTLAVQSASLNALTGQQAWQATTVPFAIFPDWRNAAAQKGATGFSITLSEVDFTVAAGGTTAATRWSVGNPLGQVVLRPCGGLPAVPDGQPSSMATLPAGVFGPTSMLVGDVAAVFVPVFGAVFTGPVPMLRSAYIPPRVNSGVTLSGAGPGRAVTC